MLLVTALSMLLSVQGWKSRVPGTDLAPHIYAAHGFIESGTLPRHGDTGSYGSYKPPGTAWLMMPGIVLLGDPRIADYVGTGLLHLATLAGIFLLAWSCFGAWPACLAVLLYGLSSHGLFLAGSLWPNGRPDFFVWLVLLTTQWVVRQDARYLAAALGVWGLGMYVDMAIAPALFIPAFVWLYYRPPVRPGPLVITGFVVLMVWSPYLRLQATRGFADMKSMLFLRNIFPAHYEQSWCDPYSMLHAWSGRSSTAGHSGPNLQDSQSRVPAALGPFLARLGAAKDKLLSNFTGAVALPGVNLALLVLVLASLILCWLPGASTERSDTIRPARAPPRRLPLLALGLSLLGIIMQPTVIGRILGKTSTPLPGLVAYKLPTMLLLVGLVLLSAPWLVAAARRCLIAAGLQPPEPKQVEMTRVLVLSLVIPWVLLIVVAEPGKPERFWWLWPLQVIFLAAMLAYLLPRLGVPRKVVASVQVVVALVLILNPLLLGRVRSWWTDGWAGADAEEIQVIDYVASRVRAKGKASAAIGYQLFIYPFMATYHITNPTYKVGTEFELLFKYRHGIANTDQCAEGVSPADEYRIVQTRPKAGPEEPRHYFDVPVDNRFYPVRRFDMYEVFQRD